MPNQRKRRDASIRVPYAHSQVRPREQRLPSDERPWQT
jgi:hypothetical protein